MPDLNEMLSEQELNVLVERFSFTPDVITRFNKRYGKRVIPILQALSKPSKYFFIRVNTLKTSTQKVKSILKKEGIHVQSHSTLSEALYFPIEGPFEIKNRGKTVRIAKFAAESVFTGADLFGPGVIGVEKISAGDPVSIVDPHGRLVGYGIALMNSKDLLQQKKGIGIKVLESPYRTPNLKEHSLFIDGYWFNQSLPAMIASYVLAPKPGELVVDLCAAPGGKTTHIAQLMKNEGRIIALDRSPSRTRKLQKNIERLGITNVEIYQTKNIKKKLEELNLERKVDRLIVDPPCSALGIRPKLFDTTTTRNIVDHSNYQKFFLHLAARLVKPSGVIVYSTCTMEPEENELNIKYCKEKFSWKLDEQPIFIGTEGEMGLEKEKYQRFYPDIHDTTGYFIARLKSPH
ncbi:MAG: PUA domain-containing protein [Candidatus Helarchaeota archaeon]